LNPNYAMCICGGFLTPQIARIHLYFFGYNRDLSGQGLLVATVGALSPYVGCACLGVLGLLQSSSICSPCCWMCCLQLYRSSRLLLSVVSLLSSWKLAISLLVMSFGMLELLLPGCCWFCCCCLSLAVVIPGYYYM